MTTQNTPANSLWTPESSIPKPLLDRINVLKSSPSLLKLINESSQDSNNNSSKTSFNKHVSSLFVFLTIIQQLKKTRRTGWIDHEVRAPESIADHMYRMGIISMLSNDKTLDTQRCVRIALVHDMAECLVGDITPKDPIPKTEKHRRELAAMQYLTDTIIKPFNKEAAQEIYSLWNEYEDAKTAEALFVKSVDKFELLVQTLEFEQQHERKKDLSPFISVRNQIKTKEVGEWADVLLDLRLDYWNENRGKEEKKSDENTKGWNPESNISSDLKERLDLIDTSLSIQKYIATNDSIPGLAKMLMFLHIIQQLKTTKRTGWIDHRVGDPESIADHMYRMGIICMLTNNYSTLDFSRCVSMAIIHDMAESIVGDITPVNKAISKAEKHERELATMQYLTQTLIKSFNSKAADNILELWNEYENLSTPEARFVMDIDKFELLVQAVEYEIEYKKERDLTQFMSVRDAIKTDEVQGWADALLAIRNDYWK